MKTNNVAIIGAGAYGTALALAFARAGRDVVLWGRDGGRIDAMARTRQCGDPLPGFTLEERVRPVAALDEALQSPLIVMAIPTQSLRAATEICAPHLHARQMVLCAAKGIEQKTGLFVTDILGDVLKGRVERAHLGLLSGPSFAADIAKGLPTAISLAMDAEPTARRLAAHLGSPGFRIYHTSDRRGVEIGGAAKNVLAIAAGIVAGMGLGDSARAAMITRGFAELRRFAAAFDAKPETLMGLSGLGDLLLSASSAQSRNFALGHALGQGKSVAKAMASGKLAEGAFTAGILAQIATRRGVDMPISTAVAQVLAGDLSTKDAVRGLMARPFKGE